MTSMIKCDDCGRTFRPTSKHRQFGMLGKFCTRTCKSASAFRAKRERRRGE